MEIIVSSIQPEAVYEDKIINYTLKATSTKSNAMLELWDFGCLAINQRLEPGMRTFSIIQIRSGEIDLIVPAEKVEYHKDCTLSGEIVEKGWIEAQSNLHLVMAREFDFLRPYLVMETVHGPIIAPFSGYRTDLKPDIIGQHIVFFGHLRLELVGVFKCQ
jgi:hypothetical protein